MFLLCLQTGFPQHEKSMYKIQLKQGSGVRSKTVALRAYSIIITNINNIAQLNFKGLYFPYPKTDGSLLNKNSSIIK